MRRVDDAIPLRAEYKSELAGQFARNFEDYNDAPEDVRAAGPRVDSVRA